MASLMASAADLPVNSHGVAFFASTEEETREVAAFVEGALFADQPVSIYTNSPERRRRYQAAVGSEHPWLVERVQQLDGPHVRPTEAGLRPLRSILEWAGDQPRGATMCADTIPDFLTRENLGEFLAYERWFDTLRPYPHRGLCPYDLTRMPVDLASDAIPGLVGSHSHVVLSHDPNPGVQLLQLLAVPQLLPAPAAGRHGLERAMAHGLIVHREGEDDGVELSPRGELVVRAFRARPR